MTPTPEAMVRVLDAVLVLLSDAVQQRVGGLGTDPLVVVEVLSDDQTRMSVGDRAQMRQALLHDQIIDERAAWWISRPAPPAFLWIVVNWGDEVSVLVHSADVAAMPDRRVS